MLKQNYQTQALGNKSIDSFALVGVTDKLDIFAQELFSYLSQKGLVSARDKSRCNMKRLNQTPQRYQPDGICNQDFLKRFHEFHAEDNMLYEEANKHVSNRLI